MAPTFAAQPASRPYWKGMTSVVMASVPQASKPFSQCSHGSIDASTG